MDPTTPIHSTMAEVYRLATHNRESIQRSNLCGCFFCCRIYSPQEVVRWTDSTSNDLGQTAICPKCGVDAVIGDAEIGPGAMIEELSKSLLAWSYAYWFGRPALD